MAPILSRAPGSGGRPAGPARPVPDAASVADRGEDHAPRLADALLVGASATAYDPRGHAAHEERDAPLERQQGRLEPRPERIVAPGAIAADDAMAGHDERNRIGGQRVADGTRRARRPDAHRELGVRAHVARSEERRVGKECRARWWPEHEKNKTRK